MKIRTMQSFISSNEDPEILFWVGCAGSYDERYKKVTKAFVNILNKLKVDFAILGDEEGCTGDPARRSGNEYLFQMQAVNNISTLNKYNIKRIVTLCPHCFNTIKNEYPALGGNYEVVHHSQLLNEFIKEGKIISEKINKKISYHDSCYLGRGNNIYDDPRTIINKLGYKMIEMKRSKRKSFCCGAGGAQMFKEPEKGNQDININRTNEALSLSPDIIATGCPFCNTMITDGVKNINEGSAVVKDLAELISENI